MAPAKKGGFFSREDDTFGVLYRIRLFFTVCWRGVLCVVTPLLLILTMLPFPPPKYQIVAYCLYVMCVFWITECIPLAVTALIPIVMFPLCGIMTTDSVIKCYMNDTIIMFIGSIVLAFAVEQCGLHRRIALFAIKSIGCSHNKLLGAIAFVTMFVSMWITNTAAATMMVPIAFAVLKVFEDQRFMRIYERGSDGELRATDLTACYFCTVTYSATIGGIGTLVGTVTNLVMKGLYIGAYPEDPEYLSFPKFSAYTIPLMLCMEIAVYLNMIIQYFGFLRPKSKQAQETKLTPAATAAAKAEVEKLYKDLGKISFWEGMVIILFVSAMVMFFSRSPQVFIGWADKITHHFLIDNNKYILDSAAAMLVCFLMFLLPSTMAALRNIKVETREELTKGRIPSCLDWRKLSIDLPFSFFLLLGSGFALAKAANTKHSNLNGKIAEQLSNLRDSPNSNVLLLVIIFTTLITNFTSNVAVCNVITPIAMKLAEEVQAQPLWYCLASGLAASYTFLLPVGTPGNLIVQSAAKIPTIKMVICGIGPTITTILINWIFIFHYAPVIWPILKVPYYYDLLV